MGGRTERWRRIAVLGALSVAAVVFPAQSVSAAPIHTWVGPAGGRWSVAANWSPAEVPTDGDDITLPSGSSSVLDIVGLDIDDLSVTAGSATFIDVDRTDAVLIGGDVVAPNHLAFEAVGAGPVQVQVSGTMNVGSVATDGVQLVLGGGAGTLSTGAASATGNATDWIGSVNLLRDGQHAPATALTSGAFGWIDLWGSDQQASSTVVGGSLYLGYWDNGAVTSVLQTGSLQQQPGGHIALQLGTSTSDQIRASTVSLQGEMTFGIDGIVPVGHQIRVIDNQGASPVAGAFTGMPEGSVRTSGQQGFRISYVGGTGNDVTLTRVAGLSSTWWHESAVDQGGFMQGAPALSSWGGDRLDGWIVGGDRALWHRFQQGGQNGWERLGGILTTSPAAVSQEPGQFDVFARGADNALWVRSFRNGAWGGWGSLGGIITAAPSVTSTAPGSLEVVARGADGGIWLRRSVNGVWQPWTTLGGFTTSAPAVTDWGPDQLQIAIRGGDGALWVRQQIQGTWQPWRFLGGAMQDGPAVAAPEAGQLAAYVLGGDGKVWLMSEEGGGWSNWSSTGIASSSRPAAVGTGPDLLELGVRTASGALHTHTGHQPTIRGPRDLSSS